jgi:hypothetical protein
MKIISEQSSADIQCDGRPANRPCPSAAKPLRYTCDDGATLCCGVKIKGNTRSARQKMKKKMYQRGFKSKNGNGMCYPGATDIGIVEA